MEFIQKSIQMDREKCSAGTQIALEDDINITDAKPDVYQLVTEKGHVDVEEVRAMEDHVHVKGTLHFSVLYIADEEVRRPACMEGALPFEERVFMDGVQAGDSVCVKAALEDLSIGMINSRKLSVQALLDLKLLVEETEEIAPAVGIEDADGVEVCRKQLQALNLVIEKKDILRMKEQISVPGGMPNIFCILWQDCRLKDMAFQIMDEKMTVHGSLGVFFLYEGEGEERKAVWYETELPVNGTVECQGMRAEMLEDICCRIGHQEAEVRPDEDGEERCIALDIVLELDMKLYEETKEDVIADVYGVKQEIEAVCMSGQYRQLLVKNTGKTKASGRLKTAPGVPAIQQICSAFGNVAVGGMEICEEGVRIWGTVNVQVLYASSDSELPFYCLKGSLPFFYVLEAPEVSEGCSYRIEPALEEVTASMLDADEAEVRAVLSFKGLVCRVKREDVVTGARVSALDPEKLAALPGIVAYIVQEGDSLWEIGKKYYVPAAKMKEMNGLAGEEPKAGDRLLIVKGR